MLKFGRVEKRPDMKAEVNFKIYDVRDWGANTVIAMHIFPNISTSRRYQTTKYSQLIEYNMKNIFHEASYSKCDN